MEGFNFDWINGLLIAVGGIAGALFTYWQSTRKDKLDYSQNQLQLLYDKLDKDNERLRLQEVECSKKIHECQIQIQQIRDKMANMNAVFTASLSNSMNIPVPRWIKDIHGKMVWVNNHYEDDFLKHMGLKASDYIGKTDIEIWGEEVGIQYRNNDLATMRAGAPMWVGFESIPKDGIDVGLRHLIVKILIKELNIPIAYEGFAIPLNDNVIQKITKIYENENKQSGFTDN